MVGKAFKHTPGRVVQHTPTFRLASVRHPVFFMGTKEKDNKEIMQTLKQYLGITKIFFKK